jgi:hypothetical protein
MADDPHDELHTRQLDALTAAGGDGVAEVRVDPELQLFSFATGLGDGAYVGTDHDGQIVRVVVDCGLPHLAWPT